MIDIFDAISFFEPYSLIPDKEFEISEKENELNILIPDYLKKLYCYFKPTDSYFQFKYKLIPISQLKIVNIESDEVCYSIVPFLFDNKYTYAYTLKPDSKSNNANLKKYLSEDNPAITFFDSNDTKTGIKKSGACSNLYLKDLISHCLGYAQIYSLSNIIALDSETISIKDRRTLWDTFMPVESVKSDIYINTENKIMALRFYEDAPVPFSSHSYVFGATSKVALNQLEERCGFQFIWLKREGKLQIGIKQEVFVPEEREIFSIQLVLDFLSKFANIDKTNCATNADLQTTEKRIKTDLPLPLKEFYLHLPKQFYNVDNSLRPLSKFKPMKDGKINFLEENQGVFYCAVKPGSPFIYQKVLDNGSKWEPIGIMDGYLVSEFFWVLASADDLRMELWEYPNFDAKMLDKDGKLFPYFSDIADTTQKISEGNFMRLYQVCDGKAIALYEKTTPKLYLLARTSEDLDDIFEKFGFPKEK